MGRTASRRETCSSSGFASPSGKSQPWQLGFRARLSLMAYRLPWHFSTKSQWCSAPRNRGELACKTIGFTFGETEAQIALGASSVSWNAALTSLTAAQAPPLPSSSHTSSGPGPDTASPWGMPTLPSAAGSLLCSFSSREKHP